MKIYVRRVVVVDFHNRTRGGEPDTFISTFVSTDKEALEKRKINLGYFEQLDSDNIEEVEVNDTVKELCF